MLAAAAADLLLHGAGRAAERRALQLVSRPRDAVVEDEDLDPEIMRRYGFLVDGPSPTNPDGLPVGFAKALRHAAERGDARHHLRRLSHRADQRHAQRPNDGAAHRRRVGAARVHQREHRAFRADARGLTARHAGQSDEVQPLRRRGARPESQGRPLGAARGRCSMSPAQFGTMAWNEKGARPGADRRGLRPHRRAGADRQHRVR